MHHSILWSQVLILLLYLGHSQLQPFLCRMTSKTYRSWLWSLSKKPELFTFPLSPFSCYNWTWIQVFVGIERRFTSADFPFWSWLRPRPCQIFIERSLGHFLHCAEALTSPQEWQPHVAFNGWTLQSTADLLFAKGAPRRKQKTRPGLCPGGSLTAVQQWTELCVTACNPSFQTRKQSAHLGSARCLQLTVLLFNGPGGDISQRRERLLWFGSPQKLRAARRRNSVSFLALLSSVRSVVNPFLWSRNYFVDKMGCSHILSW